MPRKPRVHYFNATYHVMLRGNYQQNIFMCDKHYHMFYQILEVVTKQYDCKVHLFCLMTNHAHLVIEVGHIYLSRIVQHITSTFSRKVNNDLDRQGHLFQGRYQSKLVESDRYFLELCSYIHSNPLKAKMVNCLDDYPWSSHQAYSKHQNLTWLCTSQLESLLGKTVHAKDPYQEFMSNKDDYQQRAEFLDFDENGHIIIKDSIQKKVNEKRLLPEKLDLSLLEIIDVVTKDMRLPVDELTSEIYSKKASLARSMVAYFAHYHAGYYLKDIALVMNRRPDGISRQLNKTLKCQSTDRSLQRLLESLSRRLFSCSAKRA